MSNQEAPYSRFVLQDRLHAFLDMYTQDHTFAVAENGFLTTYKVDPNRITHKFGSREVIVNEVFGAMGGQFVFQRQRLRQENGLVSTEWYLMSEGPVHWIRYWRLEPDSVGALLFGMHLPDYPEMGINYSYNCQTGVKSSVGSSTYNGFVPSEPRFHHGGIMHEQGAMSGGRNFVRAPKQIDSLVWVPRIEDHEDKVIYDPTLPWHRWFEQIGIEMLGRSMMPHESWFD